MASSATANCRGVIRGSSPTIIGADVIRMLWLKTPKIAYSEKATKNPSVRESTPNSLT